MYQQFYTDIRQIKHKFSRLQALVRQGITDYRLLIAHVLEMGILSKNDEEQIKKTNSTNEVFMILTKYWSFIDCEPLENIIDLVGNEEGKEILKEYHIALKEFCQRRIFESSDSLYGDEHTEKKKLDFALDLNDPAVRCMHRRNLKIAIANILNIQVSDLILHDLGSDRNPGKVNY